MADRKATNKYYPPEYFDALARGDKVAKDGLNAFRGTHVLRERAKKLHSDGILVVRFEMPLDAWCGSCGVHIAKGTRFNAEKKRNGYYFSTPIWSFAMKCRGCSARLVVETDPKNTTYVVVEGGRWKAEPPEEESLWQQVVTGSDEKGLEPGEEGVIDLIAMADMGALAESPSGELNPGSMEALELHAWEEKYVKEENRRLEILMEDRTTRYRDDYKSSQRLRKRFRTRKREIIDSKEQDAEIKQRLNVENLPLVPPSGQDSDEALRMMRAKKSLVPRRLESRPFQPRRKDAAHGVEKYRSKGMSEREIRQIQLNLARSLRAQKGER
mmetsp:Transcript_2197/g.3788  ORF Transcript_2197/g.3788 Transcript_2197/m.3788 type:complete len:327 (-) Transcript_2197:446-1426(-)